ncbi:unnamed protein product, partial [Closterium sp. Naga37s-1]
MSSELGHNFFTGSFPSQFSDLVNLEHLEVGYMDLAGELHSSLGNLTNLRMLSVRENALQGSIPATLGLLGGFTIIQLGGNQLTGSIPASFSNLVNLQGLYLWQNQLNGSMDVLISCTALEQIAIQYNQFTGSIPTAIGLLQSLNYFMRHGAWGMGHVACCTFHAVQRQRCCEQQVDGIHSNDNRQPRQPHHLQCVAQHSHWLPTWLHVRPHQTRIT